MRVIVKFAFGVFFERESHKHKVWVVGQNLSRYSGIRMDDWKFGQFVPRSQLILKRMFQEF